MRRNRGGRRLKFIRANVYRAADNARVAVTSRCVRDRKNYFRLDARRNSMKMEIIGEIHQTRCVRDVCRVHWWKRKGATVIHRNAVQEIGISRSRIVINDTIATTPPNTPPTVGAGATIERITNNSAIHKSCCCMQPPPLPLAEIIFQHAIDERVRVAPPPA